jgi:hypothetical protein
MLVGDGAGVVKLSAAGRFGREWDIGGEGERIAN